jgi:hypothetical protein
VVLWSVVQGSTISIYSWSVYNAQTALKSKKCCLRRALKIAAKKLRRLQLECALVTSTRLVYLYVNSHKQCLDTIQPVLQVLLLNVVGIY